MFYIILNLAAAIFAAYIAKIGIEYNKGNEKSKEISNLKMHPAELNLLVLDTNYLNRAILVTLLELFKNKNIEIIQYKKDSENEFTFILKNRENLLPHENAFVDAVFGDKKEVTTEDLLKEIGNGKEFFSKLKKWHESLENSLKEKDFYENKYKIKAKKIRLSSYIIFILGVISISNKALIGILGISSALVITLIGINMGIGKSDEANSIHHYYMNFLENAKKNTIERDLDEDELFSLIAMGITMKYFSPIYEKNLKYESVNLFSDYKNEFGGSSLDDCVLKSFNGFKKKTTKDNIDTNRMIFKISG